MVLYKYLKPSLIKVLENGFIRFTQPTCFNDPFESLAYVRNIFDIEFVKQLFIFLSNPEFKKDIENNISDKNTKDNLIDLQRTFKNKSKEELKDFFRKLIIGESKKDLSTEIQKYWDSQVGILSLSETNDNLTMWSHYSEAHTGFVIGFDTNISITDVANILIKPKKINYCSERPSITLFDIKKEKKEMMNDWIKTFLFTKGNDWLYENEWRQINILGKADKIETKNNKNIYLFKYNRKSIVEIYFGCRMDKDIRKKILKIIRDWTVDKYNIVINKKNYKLDKIIFD